MLSSANFKYNDKLVEREFRRLSVSIIPRWINFMQYIFHKINRKACKGMYVDLKGVDALKGELKDPKTRVILLPLNKSATDQGLIHYINVFKDVQTGFFIGNFDDKIDVSWIPYSKCGVMFPRRDQRHD